MKRRKLLKSGLAGGLALGLVGIGERGLLGMKNETLASAPKLWVPPEEEAHELTFMQWPASRKVHRDGVFLKMLQQTIADIANTIVEFEPVVMLADKSNHNRAKKLLGRKVELWDIPTEDLWCRDSGPLIAKRPNGQRVVSHIQFNGWGNKQTHKKDGNIAHAVADRLGFDVVSSGLIGEAGGVEHDGHGLLLAHESSWVNNNRNPGLTRDEIEARLLSAYGADRMIWAEGVWGEDITDYHIDSLARFTGPGKVLINLPKQTDPDDPFHLAARDTHDALKKAGIELTVIYEPEQRRVRDLDFVASYANYYVCNGGIIAAQFGDKDADKKAANALKQLFPGREVVTLNVDTLGEIGGGIHCATQQLPSG